MKSIFLILLTGLIIVTVSCGGDDSGPKNSAPDSFTVAVSNITSTTADLVWTAPSDPDDDAVSYEITLNGTTLSSVSAQPAGTTITISVTDLTASTAYTGTVAASDGKNGTTEASFSFSTTGN